MKKNIIYFFLGAFLGITHFSLAQTNLQNQPTQKASSEQKYESLALFQKVLFFIEQNYVEPVDSKKLIYGAIRGLFDELDPHSSFLTENIFKEIKADTSGQFGGIGVEVGIKDNVLTVISPIEDTPAYRAGIMAGDQIIKINDELTRGLNIEEAVSKMRGKKGTKVKFTILRKSLPKPKEFILTREEIKIKSVKAQPLEKGYYYVRITNFNEHTANDLKKALEGFERESKIEGLILDLRNNPGGLLDQAVDVVSLFIDEGIVVSTKGRNENTKEIRYAKKGMARKDFPMAVLVNGSSASASEIVAGALQDHKRAVIMGQPTFGKGSVQTVVELTPELGIKLTIARYYTPSGRSIQLTGIQPDVLLDEIDSKIFLEARKKAKQKLREKDLKHAIENENGELVNLDHENNEQTDKEKEVKEGEWSFKNFDPKKDYQVLEAINYIKSYKKFKEFERR